MCVVLGIRRHNIYRPLPYRTVVLVWTGAVFLFNENADSNPTGFVLQLGTTKERQSKKNKHGPETTLGKI